MNIATQFDRMSALHKPTAKHTAVNYETDLQMLLVKPRCLITPWVGDMNMSVLSSHLPFMSKTKRYY